LEIRRQHREQLSPIAYLDRATDLLDDSGDTNHAMTALLDEVMLDNSLVFDSEWQAEFGQCLDNEDAFLSQAKAINPPAQFAAYHELITTSFDFMADSGDEWRAFFFVYDRGPLQEAGGVV